MVRRQREKNESTAPRKRARLGRIALWAVGSLVLALALVWYAVHHFDWAGPLVANSLRAVLGDERVARLEDFVYGAEDGVNRLLKKNAPPKSYWQVPAANSVASAAPVASSAPSAAAQAGESNEFNPKNVGPALKEWSAAGDGDWVAVKDPRHVDEPARIFKTLLHPDKERSWAEVFVVAIDLKQVEIFPVVGTQEPQPDSDEARKYVRDGKIPVAKQPILIAAFNGGFMTEHGGYGMKLDGVTIAKPKARACTIAFYKDDSMRIASWPELSATEPDMLWFRQTPECMWEKDVLHAGLQAGAGLKKWGSTVDGETVIRRSGIGLNAERSVVYFAITNHTTARVLADGLHHAGATDVAQLDVNWSYPKFVTFEPIGHTNVLHPVPLAPGFEYSDDEYLRKKEKRDFFYIVRREPAAKASP
ncbi:MAG TPA: hypothetical protein VHV51_01550 [Polyangiaceae bacterium]|jgi:hypothetical protein|nr:hypothetical protein [Polyangiaceae bacterium]